MEDTHISQVGNSSRYVRAESRLVQKLPFSITPLRFRILLGYLFVFLLTIYGWDQITAAWRYLVTLLAPAFALIGAVVALKIGVVLVSLLTLAIALIKFFFSFLMIALKPGILKAIFIPPLLSLATWFHRKSARLQNIIETFYQRFKTIADNLVNWWKAQQALDKILLSGFLIPLLVILVIVFVVEKTTAIFSVKKLAEQLVQRVAKYVISNFHRIPGIGGIPTSIANTARTFTAKQDREDVVDDFKTLGNELYHPEQNDTTDQTTH